MNILLFVMSLLMMLALITYSRLDMYKNFVVTQSKFEHYMMENERNVINQGAQQWYDWTTLSTKNSGPKKSAPKDASPKLGIHGLFNPDEQTSPQQKASSREILKRLIHQVFGGQKDFQRALDKNSHLVDDLITAIETAGKKLTAENKPILTTDSLENLDLENPTLQDVFYGMLKGFHITKPQDEKKLKLASDRTEGEGDRDESTDPQAEEHVHQDGTISFLDFITVNPQKTKIRLFLAPKALLSALFEDAQTVEEILKNRLELYRQMIHEKDQASLTEQFKHQFEARARNIPETMLDFTVTATDPRQYEVQ